MLDNEIFTSFQEINYHNYGYVNMWSIPFLSTSGRFFLYITIVMVYNSKVLLPERILKTDLVFIKGGIIADHGLYI